MKKYESFLKKAQEIQNQFDEKHQIPYAFRNDIISSSNRITFFKRNPEDQKKFDKWIESSPYHKNLKLEKESVIPYIQEEILFWCWELGGVSGGSCWEDSNPSSYKTGEVEPEAHVLDAFLMEECPKITLMEYKKIFYKLVKSGTHTEYEYYGNNTKYAYKYISIKELYDFLNI